MNLDVKYTFYFKVAITESMVSFYYDYITAENGPILPTNGENSQTTQNFIQSTVHVARCDRIETCKYIKCLSLFTHLLTKEPCTIMPCASLASVHTSPRIRHRSFIFNTQMHL